jgi:hypothetical protein
MTQDQIINTLRSAFLRVVYEHEGRFYCGAIEDGDVTELLGDAAALLRAWGVSGVVASREVLCWARADWSHGATEHAQIRWQAERPDEGDGWIPLGRIDGVAPSWIDEARHLLQEASGFAAMSPRGRENIAAVLDLLDRMDPAGVREAPAPSCQHEWERIKGSRHYQCRKCPTVRDGRLGDPAGVLGTEESKPK